MTFLNATLIFGMAAAAVPLVLHLIARREPRRVVFPSIRFLTKRFESNRSRLRVRRWWLLAMRIAALALLALALARPAIHRSLSLTWLTIGLVAAFGVILLLLATVALIKNQPRATTYGLTAAAATALVVALLWSLSAWASAPSVSDQTTEPVAMAIVLDNAPTSAWSTPDDDRLERMKELATWMVTRLPETSRIAILDRSAQMATFSLDSAGALAKAQQLEVRQFVQPIESRIDAAIRLVRSSDLPNRQVLVVTDLAVASWDDSLAEAGLAARLGEEPAVAVTVFDLGSFEGSNRALSLPELSDPTPAQGVPIPLSTTLQWRSGGDRPTASVTAELEMYQNDPALPVVRDGKITRPPLRSVDRTSVKIPAGGASELLLTIPAQEIGTHHGRVRLVGDDAMPLDDVRYFSLEVLPPSRVLVAGDDEDEAEVIRQAIIAAPGLIEGQQSEFTVERVAFTDLDVVRLNDFEAIFLLDPPASALENPQLADFVRAGGGLFVGLGPAMKPLPRESSVLLPALQRRWRAPAPGTFLQVTTAAHPVTQALAEGTPWADFRVQQYWRMETSPRDRTLIRYAGTEHAALLERTLVISSEASDSRESAASPAVGSTRGNASGSILILSTPLPALAQPSASWNELFGIDPWPAWLLTRQSVEYLTRRSRSGVITSVGTPITLQLSGLQLSGMRADETSQAADSEVSETERLQLFPPGDASPRPLEVSPQAEQVVVTDVSQAGTYWLRGVSPTAGFSANLEAEATRLERLDVSELDQIFGPDRYTLARNREEIEFAESGAAQRVSLHSPAILLVLIIFLLEQILSNRFYRSSAA